MKCSRIRKVVVTADLGALPPEAARHVESCPHCARLVERTVHIRGVVALKRYETPDPHACERAVNRFRHREILIPAPGVHALTMLGFPTAVTGIAAAFVALLGVNLHLSGELPTLNSAITRTEVRTLQEFLTSAQPDQYQPFFTILPTGDLSFSNRPTGGPRRPGANSVFFVND